MCLRLLGSAALPRTATALAAVALACGEPAAPVDPPAAAAGTYVLESVDGCALGTPAEQCPHRRSWLVGGTMVLAADGRVARVVQYQFPEDAGPVTEASLGTFTVRRGAVDLTLRQERDGTWYVWRVRATLADGRLTMSYPHPADGETVEVFRRE